MKISSYFYLELDTTPPIVEIYTPKYTTKSLENYITIESNETLSANHEIYSIDSEGNRHDYTFSLDENRLIGNIKFSDFPIGLVTLYVKVSDTVGNESEYYQKQIEVKENLSKLNMIVDDYTRNIHADTSTKNIILETSTRNIFLGIE